MNGCPDNFQIVPEKFRAKVEIRDDSKFGQFILNEQKVKDKIVYSPLYQKVVTMSKYELLTDVLLNSAIDIEDLLNSIGKPSELALRGNLYEALWDIVIKLDQHPYYNSSNKFLHLTSKIENNQFILSEPLQDLLKFLQAEHVMTGNKAGISDITLRERKPSELNNLHDVKWACVRKFVDNEQDNFILCSVKYFTREKHIDKYNIQEIVSVMETAKHKFDNINYKIVLFVRNKHDFKQMADRAKDYKRYFQDDVIDVFDLEDLCDIVHKMRQTKSTMLLKLKKLVKRKPRLQCRFHQLLFVNMTIDKLFGLNGQPLTKQILWGQIARSGKTFTAGLLISKLKEYKFFDDIKTKENRQPSVLVITPAPGETMSQWKEMFEGFLDFIDFKVEVYNSKFKKDKYISDKPTIFLCSKQFLQGKKEKEDVIDDDDENNIKADIRIVQEKCGFLHNKIDLVVFDEIHYGGSTDLTRIIMDTIDPLKKAINIFLTATYKKPFLTYNMELSQLMTWGLNEIQMCKHISSEQPRQELMAIYGKEYVNKTLVDLVKEQGITEQALFMQIEKEYRKFPSVHILTTQFDSDKVTDIIKDNPNCYGFDINSLFELTSDKTHFKNEASLHNVFNYIGDFSNSRSIYSRIEQTLQQYNQNRPFTSQLWFLPFFVGNKIRNIAAAARALLSKNANFKDYDIIEVVDPKQTKEEIKKREIIAFKSKEKKKGLIMLAGKKFSLGVSLPCVDAVFFLNNDIEVDVIYQRMFRSLTESDGKKLGFLVDLNPYRCINAVMEYTIKPKDKKDVNFRSTDEQVKNLMRMIKNGTIYLDDDIWNVTTKHATKYRDLYNSVNDMIQKNFANKKIFEVSEEIETQLLTQFTTYGKEEGLLDIFDNSKNKNQLSKLALLRAKKALGKGRKGDEAPNGNHEGQDKVRPPSGEKNGDEEIESVFKNMTTAWRDIIVILAIMLKDNASNLHALSFEDLLKSVYNKHVNTTDCSEGEDDDEMSSDVVFNMMFRKFEPSLKNMVGANKCQTFIYFLDKCINCIMNKNNMFDLYNSLFVTMKEGVANIDTKDMTKLHAYVEKHLPPKTFEKKQFGEVFTPLALVREMLDAIDKYADKDFWKNPDLKILDPAAGIGNFPLIAFEKLDEGLKDKIPNASKRKRHILENMLYMVELNGNNVRLMKKILGGDKYNLNIIKGDALSETTHAKVTKCLGETSLSFDLIMGNPPYQPQSDDKKGGKSLWTDFVIQSLGMLKKNAYLTFIHPALWRKPGNDMRQYLFTRQMLRLVIRNKIQGQSMFQSTTRYDWYVLRNHSSVQKTVVNFEDETDQKMQISPKVPFIPNFGWTIFKKVLQKLDGNNGIQTQGDSACHTSREFVTKTPNDKYPYVLVNSISKTKGINYAYSSKPHPHQNNKKVIFSNGEVIVPIYDSGKLGVTQGGIYILVKDENEGNMLVKYLKSKLVRYIVMATKWSNFETNKQIFWYIPQPQIIGNLTDSGIYTFFGLSRTEIYDIESKVETY